VSLDMNGSSLAFNRTSSGLSLRAIRTALSDAAERWSDAEAYRLSAALSFYALSSIFPLMLVAVSVGELVLGASAEVRGTLISALDGTNSETVRGLLEDTLEGVQAAAPRSHWGVVVGLLGALFGASGIFLELDTALNKIFRVPQIKRSFWQDIVNTLRERAAALGLVMVTSAILLFGTLLLAGADVLATRLPKGWAGAPGLVSNLSTLALTSVALTLCYRVIPEKSVRLQTAALGALLAGLGLLAVRWPLTFAVVHLTSYAAYGVVGVLLLVMTWLYVASNIMMFGAALAATLDERASQARARSRAAGSDAPPDSRSPRSIAL
jgi:membrane protein